METYQKIILGVMGAILCALIVLIIVLPKNSDGTEDGKAKQEFVKPEFDMTAVAGVPDIDEEALNYNVMKLNNNISVSACAELTLNADNTVNPYFTSAPENEVWVRLFVYDAKGNEMGSTGVLKPGEYVKSVQLKNIPAETGLIVYKIVTYEPETYFSVGTANAQVLLHID